MKKTTVSLAISTLLWLGAIASQHAWSHSAHANQHVLWSSSSAHAKDPWQTLPPPVVLPSPRYNGTAKINNIDLWYGTYGASLQDSQAYGHSPVVFLHGGFANSELSLSPADLPDGSVPALEQPLAPQPNHGLTQ